MHAGYLVVRCYCKQKEQRRQRMFEKALDAAATSPFARGVTRWLLAGSLTLCYPCAKPYVHLHASVQGTMLGMLIMPLVCHLCITDSIMS